MTRKVLKLSCLASFAALAFTSWRAASYYSRAVSTTKQEVLDLTNKGAGQLMVSDGRNLWFFDRDLEQVTVKPVDAALSATPAMLLSGTVDVRKNFNLTLAGQRDGLDWVLVEPHGADADFKDALFGFANGDLKRMILEDKLGQTATIMFDHIERNGPVTPQETSFTPPKGADVIGKPKK